MRTSVFPGDILILAFLVFLAALFMMIHSRQPRARLLASFKPASPPPPCWTSRIVETSALAYASILAFVLIVLDQHSRGVLTELCANLPLPIAGLSVTILCAVGILAALYVGVAWRTWAAALLIIMLLLVYILGFDRGMFIRTSHRQAPRSAPLASFANEGTATTRTPTDPHAP